MASGSSGGRPNKSGSKGSFDFASDDILCSYEDYDDRKDPSNGNHSDSIIGANSSKDLEKNRISRSSVFPTTNMYAQPEVSLNQEMVATIENTMKRYTDNCMRFLEGISSRLSQLELYCYNLDKSIGEMRTELARDNKETDGKLKSLDKHLQEVHRSVQILRDKQELAETQKELAKLQLAQKEEKSATTASETKKSEDGPEIHSQQLALALPHQIVQQPSLPARPTEQPQPPPYYLPATPAAQPQPQPPPQPQPQPPYAPPPPPPQYQQQWPPQPTQPQTQIRAPPTPYPSYIQNQPPQQGVSRADMGPYGYGGPGRPPQPMKGGGGDGYPASGGSYMMYDGSHHPPQPQSHFSQGYPQPRPRPPPPPAQFVRSHPYGEVIEKLVSMGYRGDHVASVIQRLEETGQPVDFNSVLDRLNGHSSGGSSGGGGGSQRPW